MIYGRPRRSGWFGPPLVSVKDSDERDDRNQLAQLAQLASECSDDGLLDFCQLESHPAAQPDCCWKPDQQGAAGEPEVTV